MGQIVLNSGGTTVTASDNAHNTHNIFEEEVAREAMDSNGSILAMAVNTIEEVSNIKESSHIQIFDVNPDDSVELAVTYTKIVSDLVKLGIINGLTAQCYCRQLKVAEDGTKIALSLRVIDPAFEEYFLDGYDQNMNPLYRQAHTPKQWRKRYSNHRAYISDGSQENIYQGRRVRPRGSHYHRNKSRDAVACS